MNQFLTQRKQVILACGVLLMLGWFTLTASQLGSADAVSLETGKPQEIPVLMYHHLLPANEVYGLYANNNIVVTVEDFQQQIATLQQQGYRTITLDELNGYLRGEKMLPEKSVLITFDDGYLSNYVYAKPILERAGYSAVVFLLTSYVEDEVHTFNPRALQYLSWFEIEEMKDTFEFACHTDHLHKLNNQGRSVLLDSAAADVVADLDASRIWLDTVYYSYPYGGYNKQLEQVLKGEGIELAFVVNPKSVKLGDNPLELSRWDMYQYSMQEVLGQKK